MTDRLHAHRRGDIYQVRAVESTGLAAYRVRWRCGCFGTYGTDGSAWTGGGTIPRSLAIGFLRAAAEDGERKPAP